MKTKGFRYDIRVYVKFTKKEAKFLIAQARIHYDSTCRSAGQMCKTGASENGFLAQLVLFPEVTPAWTFSQFDVCLKILEPWRTYNSDEALRRKLVTDLINACNMINKRHKELEEKV